MGGWMAGRAERREAGGLGGRLGWARRRARAERREEPGFGHGRSQRWDAAAAVPEPDPPVAQDARGS